MLTSFQYRPQTESLHPAPSAAPSLSQPVTTRYTDCISLSVREAWSLRFCWLIIESISSSSGKHVLLLSGPGQPPRFTAGGPSRFPWRPVFAPSWRKKSRRSRNPAALLHRRLWFHEHDLPGEVEICLPSNPTFTANIHKYLLIFKVTEKEGLVYRSRLKVSVSCFPHLQFHSMLIQNFKFLTHSGIWWTLTQQVRWMQNNIKRFS